MTLGSRYIFWNTPPESTTWCSPVRSRICWHCTRASSTTVFINFAARASGAVPASSSWTSSRDHGPEIPVHPVAAGLQHHRIVVLIDLCHGLQQDRALALIGHVCPAREDGVDAVKEPAHTAGSGGIQSTGNHFLQQTSFFLRQAGPLRASGVQQQRKGHPADLLDRPVSSRQGDGTQAAQALESLIVSRQELTAPDRAVGTVTGAVPDHARCRVPPGRCPPCQEAMWA